MEKEERGKKRKMKRKRSKLQHTSTLFGIMVAALSNNKNSNSIIIIKQCLYQLRLSLVSKQTLTIPILSLFPLFLNSKCAEIASSSLEIVGAASLFSLEMNEQIASDEEIVKSLISSLSSSNKSVSLAACNAILDLSTTSVGRQWLLELSSIENLISCFIQVSKSSAALVSLFTDKTDSETCLRIGFKEDEFPVLLLQAAVTLINTCTTEQLEKIPPKLSKSLLVYLKKLWAEVHKLMLLCTIPKFSPGKHFHRSNIRTNNLAESIFRLSINGDQFTTPSIINDVKRSIFGLGETKFEHFMLNHWEVSPLLITRPSKGLTKPDDFFRIFGQFLRFEEAAPSFLSSILQNFISSIPINSDELNVLSFLKEARNHIGCPLIDQQDIRVLKTQHLNKEVHFFQERSGSYRAPHFLYINDILRCEEAYKEGYTISVRGMEFRFESIAAVADGLASLFGQPSAGVNMYLTPPNSQGLARHLDDHCVLVCQLMGVKEWRVFPRSISHLPRLYEHADSSHDLEGECKKVLLKEGDVLYIPRGFPHEALTVVDSDKRGGSAGFSLHLTLAIEVEPPFEWEGFAHVALHHWDQKKNLSRHMSTDCLSWNLYVVSVNLIHIAIKLIGDLDPTFRKASLVGAVSLPNQITLFRQLLTKIDQESRFLDALKSLEAAIERQEDPFIDIRWLQHLNEGESIEGHNRNTPSMGAETISCIDGQHKDKLEATFMQVKSEFCSEVIFEDVEHSYKMLVEKYRKVRRQYTNGMLALHHI